MMPSLASLVSLHITRIQESGKEAWFSAQGCVFKVCADIWGHGNKCAYIRFFLPRPRSWEWPEPPHTFAKGLKPRHGAKPDVSQSGKLGETFHMIGRVRSSLFQCDRHHQHQSSSSSSHHQSTFIINYAMLHERGPWALRRSTATDSGTRPASQG